MSFCVNIFKCMWEFVMYDCVCMWGGIRNINFVVNSHSQYVRWFHVNSYASEMRIYNFVAVAVRTEDDAGKLVGLDGGIGCIANMFRSRSLVGIGCV